MPALYKFPPHPLCPHIQFRRVIASTDEHDLPPWPHPDRSLAMGMRQEKVCVASQQPAREELCALHHIAHGGAASFVPDSGSEHQGSGSSVIFGRPHRAARRTHEDKHRELDALELKIPYSMAVVPDCTITGTGIHGSILCPAFKREIWEASTGELLHLCHEAAERRSEKTGAFHGIFHEHAEAERLSLEFIQERMETDDPMRGYLIRTNDDDRYLQGFIWYTTFTSWTHYFRWDSLAPDAGLTNSAEKHSVRWDQDGVLAGELELQFRSGDPRHEGVIWPKVAEISLMGALSCGELLMQLVLEEMEAAHTFDYAVVQATESSAAFYDKMGFVRVGALAKYIKPGEGRQAAVIPPVAYRHFVAPDQDVKDVDHSIMMAIRLRAGHVPRRIMASKGGVFANLGRDVPVGLSAMALDPETVQKLLSSDISGGEIEAKVVGDTLVLGPGASDFSLRLLAEHMGGEQWARAKAVLQASEQKDASCAVPGRAGRASSELARRKMNLWMSPTAHRSWTCYGTVPETTADEVGKRSARGTSRRGQGSRVVRSRALPSPRFKGMSSPSAVTADETPRRKKSSGLDISECMEASKRSLASRLPAVPELARASSPTGGASRLRKETVRDICIQLNIPITRKLPFVKLNATKSKQQLISSLGKFSKDSPIGWLYAEAITLETLRSICLDLNLDAQGSEKELRRSLVETMTKKLGEFAPEGGALGVAASDAAESEHKSHKKVKSPQIGHKKANKIDDAAEKPRNEGQETCAWDLVSCEACGSGDGEERIILCDGCDAAFHLECASPPLDEVPEGEWYCVPCGHRLQLEAERERKAAEAREDRNRKDRERRAQEKQLRDALPDDERRVLEEREAVERQKQLEREERQRQAREQRDKRLEDERRAKDVERGRKMQRERERRAKEERDKEMRDRVEAEERVHKAGEKEELRDSKAKVQSETEAGAGKRDVAPEAKISRLVAEGKPDKQVDKGRSKEKKRDLRGKVPDALQALFADWDVADDDDGWREKEIREKNQKLKHTWYGGPGMEWLSKETLRSVCQELDLPTNRKLPCTKITVAKSKQQLIGTIERWDDGNKGLIAWMMHPHVSVCTLRAVCVDLCINGEGNDEAMRLRIQSVFDNPDVYVERMLTQGLADEASFADNAWDQIECERCHSTEDEERMVLCDMCDAGYHIDCLEPKLFTIPEGEWICEECSQPKDKKKRRSNAEVETSDPLGGAASGVQLKKRRQNSDGKSPNGKSGVAVRVGAQDEVICKERHGSDSQARVMLVAEDEWLCSDCNAGATTTLGKTRRRRRTKEEMEAAGAAAVAASAGKGEGASGGSGGRSSGVVQEKTKGETPWDEVRCGKCLSTENEDKMVLCDMCDAGYHLECAEPKLKKIPEGDWFCDDCHRMISCETKRRKKKAVMAEDRNF